jgi:hypothetical protein
VQNKLQWTIFACLLGLILSLLGCGSGGDETEEGLTKAVFIKRGDKICQDNYSKRTQRLTQLNNEYVKNQAKPPSQSLQETLLVSEVMPIFQEEAEELDDLPLPDQEAAQAQKIIRALEEAIKGVEANPGQAIARGTGVQFREAEELAKAFGFQYCGRS